MTAERERKLRTTQRKMLRRMMGTGRQKRGGKRGETRAGEAHKEEDGQSSKSSADKSGSSSSTSSDSSSDSEADKGREAEEKEEEEEDGDEEVETWQEWIKRATNLAAKAAKKAGVVDWVEEQRRRKWGWAGHVARREDGRWSRRLLDWEPPMGRRSWGRPVLRWSDSLTQFAKTKGETWEKTARDQMKWSSWEDEFAAKRW